MRSNAPGANQPAPNPKAQRPEATRQPTAGARNPGLVSVFCVGYGIFLGLCLLKFGNPPIMEHWVTPPQNSYEFLLGFPWPITWAYSGLAAITIIGIAVAKWPATPTSGMLIALLLTWWGWQVVATIRSIDDGLSTATLKHLTAVLVCFFLGFCSLSRARNLGPFWIGIFVSLIFVIWTAWGQHFGGLKESREYFLMYVLPKLHDVPAEYLKKLNSDRVFGTYFYPNTLAGGILLLLPPTLALLWQTDRFTKAARVFLVAATSVGCFGCLFWSGSKGGWLLMLLLGVVALLRTSISVKQKISLIIAVVVIGCGAFFARHILFFKKGATSVSARFDYWRAAATIIGEHPVTGTGPGTFFIPYQAIKKPESEPARLVHNDYLEQGTDAGLPAMLLYLAFSIGSLVLTAKQPEIRGNWLVFALWLGLLGFFVQEFIEFSLYIPSMAWPAFTLLGWLLARAEKSKLVEFRALPA
jgi:putative inorganic carbon (hco3(-)) transporter